MEEVHKALNKYRDSLKGCLAGVHSFDNDLFMPEIDGKSARIIAIG